MIELKNIVKETAPNIVSDMGNCLNGIAYNQETNEFLITGKYWPILFTLQFNEWLYNI